MREHHGLALCRVLLVVHRRQIPDVKAADTVLRAGYEQAAICRGERKPGEDQKKGQEKIFHGCSSTLVNQRSERRRITMLSTWLFTVVKEVSFQLSIHKTKWPLL